MDFMREKGLTILRNGYPIIPIVPGEKRPAIDGWRTVEPTEQLVSGWSGGIGIRTGLLLAIDVDIPNAIADRVRSLTYRMLGQAPVRFGNPPKLLMLYRANTLFRTHLSRVYYDLDRNRCAIEALADGRQFVSHAIHPLTGKPYWWVENVSPENVLAGDLTVVTEAQVLELFRLFDLMAIEEGWTLIGGSKNTTVGPDELPRQIKHEPVGLSEEAIRRMLMAVPNDRRFDAREDWLKIGFAVHHETGGSGSGRELWREWSEQHPSHSQALFDKAWDSMGTHQGEREYAEVTFRYIQSILKLQRQAELAAQLDVLHWKIDLATSLDELTAAARAIGRIPDVDPVRREGFAVHVKEVSRRLGVTLSITMVREMLRHRPVETEMPEWLKGWVFLSETSQFYNMSTGEHLDRTGFDFSFNRYIADLPPSRYATQYIKIPVYHHTAYLPHEGPVYADASGVSYVNVYRDFAPAVPVDYTERDRANIELVRNHALHLFGPGLERDIEILHSALAYIVQTRRRIGWLILIQGAEAVGKTFYAQLLRAVLGEGPHVHEVSSDTLTESHFTGWAEGHLVVYIEELMVHGKRYDVLNKMKTYIANKTVSIHNKYRAPHNTVNVTSYLAFTNFRDAIPLEDSDTRHFVLLSQWQNKASVDKFKAENPRYYDRLFAALEESAGALRRWLLEYPLHPDFRPETRAPLSHGRELLVREATPEIQHQIEDLLEADVPGIGNDLLIVHLLRDALADESGVVPTPEAIRQMLRRLQFTPVAGGRVKITDITLGERKNFYCWSRNQEVVKAPINLLRKMIEDALLKRTNL